MEIRFKNQYKCLKMTHQEFNYIYFAFTKDKRGVKPQDQIITTGSKLKEFLEYAIEKHLDNHSKNQADLF